MARHGMVLMLMMSMVMLQSCRMHAFMYYLNRYDATARKNLAKHICELEYRTSAGRQVAFYVAPRQQTDGPPERLWVLFGGNGAVALDWLRLVGSAPDRGAGFLLLDYPGCGANQGHPNIDSIQESCEAALGALAAHLDVAPDFFEGRMCLLGHSLGCATALQFATRHQVRRVVLLAPFTNMVEIAMRIVGWPLCNFVPDRYDNAARLKELAQRRPRPAVVIIHGERDNVVPVTMGRKLAGQYPGWIRYRELPRADHLSVLTEFDQVYSAMATEDAASEHASLRD